MTPSNDRQAPPRAWQRMLSGRRLDLLNPAPADIEIEDIAHGLARVARWNGQTVGAHAFSVAQHALIVEDVAFARNATWKRQWRLAALLHDAPEYVVGDLISQTTGDPGGRCDVREDRVHGAPGPARRRPAADAPAIGDPADGDPAISGDHRVDRTQGTAGTAAARRCVPRHAREHTRTDLEGLRRGEPGQGEEAAQLHATGDDRGRIDPLPLASVGRVVRVEALGHLSGRQVRHRLPPPPGRC